MDVYLARRDNPPATTAEDDDYDDDYDYLTDYARRIHWWVRLFGVVWLISLAIGLCLGVYAAVAISNQHKLDSVNNCVTYGIGC
jgi:hypothetical protein